MWLLACGVAVAVPTGVAGWRKISRARFCAGRGQAVNPATCSSKKGNMRHSCRAPTWAPPTCQPSAPRFCTCAPAAVCWLASRFAPLRAGRVPVGVCLRLMHLCIRNAYPHNLLYIASGVNSAVSRCCRKHGVIKCIHTRSIHELTDLPSEAWWFITSAHVLQAEKREPSSDEMRMLS